MMSEKKIKIKIDDVTSVVDGDRGVRTVRCKKSSRRDETTRPDPTRNAFKSTPARGPRPNPDDEKR
jgi:hypothetical protein